MVVVMNDGTVFKHVERVEFRADGIILCFRNKGVRYTVNTCDVDLIAVLSEKR